MKIPTVAEIKAWAKTAKKALASLAALVVALTTAGLIPKRYYWVAALILAVAGAAGVYKAPRNAATPAERARLIAVARSQGVDPGKSRAIMKRYLDPAPTLPDRGRHVRR